MSGNYGGVNSDGFIDLLLGNGSPRMERLDTFVPLENDQGHLSNTTFSAGPPFPARAMAPTAPICLAMAACR